MADIRVMPKHVDRLLSVLTDVAAKWILFMGQLGLSPARISQIERDVPPGDHRSVECLRAALLQWISASDNPTYDEIVAVLKGPVLGDAVLAEAVEIFANSEFIFWFKLLKSSLVAYSNKIYPIFSPFTDEVGPDAVEFDVNMTAEELSELFRQKGVDEDDCALFRSKAERFVLVRGHLHLS